MARDTNDRILKLFRHRAYHLNAENPSRYFTLFHKFIRRYPHCSSLYNEMGCFLNKLRHVLDALHYFEKSLAFAKDNISSRQNFNNLSNHLLSGWHFPMLNDQMRNNIYSQAIEIMIKKFNSACIMDIGSGTGLLSLLCCKYGAKKVYACESNPLMFDICSKVLALPQNSETPIKVVPKESFQITIGQDIHGPVDLLVIELFDAGFLGEGIIPVLKDFWERLARKSDNHQPACRVIPHSASLKCALVESDGKLRKPLQKLVTDGPSHPSLIASTRVEAKRFKDQAFREPYNSQKPIKARYMSPFVKIAELCLEDECSVNKFIGQNDDDEILLAKIPLSLTTSGYCDTIAMGFDLQMLGHCNEDLIISSLHPDSCWEIAYYTFVNGPVFLEAGPNKYSLNVFSKQTYLVFDLYTHDRLASVPDYIVPCQSSITSSQMDHLMREFEARCLALELNYNEHEVFSIINDRHYLCAFEKAVSSIIESHIPTTQTEATINFCDYSQGPSIAGWSLNNYVKPDLQLNLLQFRECPLDLTFDVTYPYYPNLTVNNKGLENVGNKDNNGSILYFGDIVDPKGMLCCGVLENLKAAAKEFRSRPGVLAVMPHSVTLYMSAIESSSLANKTTIADLGFMREFGITDIVNRYRASIFMDFDLNEMPHRNLGDLQFEITTLEISDLIKKSDSDETLENVWNRIIYVNLPIFKDGNLTALPFWFDIHLGEPCHQNVISTLNSGCHWKQAAFIMSEVRPVKAGQTLKLKVTIENDYIDINILAIH